jgi:hypothetical protein
MGEVLFMTAPTIRKPDSKIPPLENGDHLTRDEFERRYRAMPAVKKAELIEGVVYMPSPVRFDVHGEHHADLVTWLGVYRLHTRGVRIADNSTVRLDLDNEPQPDAALFIDRVCGGRVLIDEEGYIVGAPDLVGEIAASSVSIDLGQKFFVYRRNAVCEYLVWRVEDRAIDWFVVRSGQLERMQAASDGSLRSAVFPGLWLDAAALLGGDLPRVHQVLHLGLASPEHAAFAARLASAPAK